jgi:uncharacterized protein (TIGR02271 family)
MIVMRTETDFSNYIGHDVVDTSGNKIGTLECLWTDNNNEPTFLGVRTGWLIGKTHVVPAHQAYVSERGRRIRLPYDADRIKSAPSYDPGIELDERTEQHIYSYYGIRPEQPQAQRQSATRPTGGRDQASVTLSEEELKVGKRQVEYGGVRLRKIVRTEVVNQPVELQREEFVVERVPAGQGAQARGKSFEQEEVYIPLRREEPVVQKEAHVREEVRVSKRAETERQNVQERVRKEDVQVERSGQGRQTATAGATRVQEQPRTGGGSKRDRRGDKAVFCIATSEQQASRIVDQLKSAGFTGDDISVMMPDKRSSKEFAHEKNTKAPEGATTGATTGGVLGGALGWLAGAGAIAIPGVGPFIAAGPIMAALGGAAVGAATGGLAGALIGMGMPEYEAKRYENRVHQGATLISVHSDSAEETRRAKEIFERNNAEDIGTANEKELQAKAR